MAFIFTKWNRRSNCLHKHAGDKEFLIIQGDLKDHDGSEYSLGTLVWLRDGTVHNSTTKNGCLIVACA